MSTVCVRFVFPAVSAEGAAFWIIRTAPISLRAFLWSKFWTGLVPVFVLTEGLTIAANAPARHRSVAPHRLGDRGLLHGFALVGLATGLGARYPRFNAENPSQVAGSYGGVAFMILAVLFMILLIILVGWPSSMLLWYRAAHIPLSVPTQGAIVVSFGTAVVMSLATWWLGMRSGVTALEAMGG